ncbi:transposase [Akkermansia sp. AE01SA01]|uniref:transposase n=1 Tax=Akkermansia sp. AE01SA01 TaxID=3115151 RepID=UPI0025F9D3CB|nr:transposase [uncultured Akkermansia sp.]
MRKRGCKLMVRESKTRIRSFKINPAIWVCHEFREKLGNLLQTVKQYRSDIGQLKEMVRMPLHEAPMELGKIAVTIRKWFALLIRMWRYRKNEAITEGFTGR